MRSQSLPIMARPPAGLVAAPPHPGVFVRGVPPPGDARRPACRAAFPDAHVAVGLDQFLAAALNFGLHGFALADDLQLSCDFSATS